MRASYLACLLAGAFGSGSWMTQAQAAVILSEVDLYFDGYAFSNPLTRLILTEDGSEISRLELLASGSLNDTVALTPGKLYSFTASISTDIAPGATGNLLTSAYSGGSGLAITPVPEPGSAVLVLLSAVALLKRRRPISS